MLHSALVFAGLASAAWIALAALDRACPRWPAFVPIELAFSELEMLDLVDLLDRHRDLVEDLHRRTLGGLGPSPLVRARRAVGLAAAAEEYSEALLRNYPRSESPGP